MGVSHNDKLCGLKYEICLYDIERNLYAKCDDMAEAKKTLRVWKSEGSKKKDIIVVNANPNTVFKDVFSSAVKSTTIQHSLEISDKKISRSYQPFTVIIDGVKKFYYLEVRMSVLRDIGNLEEAVKNELIRKYNISNSIVEIPIELLDRVNKAKRGR